MDESRLDSWKAIAAYLQRGVRTVQRWEREEGLPVHRLHHEKSGSVFAYREELDRWWAARQVAPAASVQKRDRPGGLSHWAAAVMAIGAMAMLFQHGGGRAAEGRATPVRVTFRPAKDAHPVWSPDGKQIAFLRAASETRSAVVVTAARGGPERRLGEVALARPDLAEPHLAWSPDGKSLIVPDRTSEEEPYSLAMLSLEDGEKRRLTEPPAESMGDSAPAVSADGRSLAFVRCATPAECDLLVVEIGGMA